MQMRLIQMFYCYINEINKIIRKLDRVVSMIGMQLWARGVTLQPATDWWVVGRQAGRQVFLLTIKHNTISNH